MPTTVPDVGRLDLRGRMALAESAEAEFMYAFEAGAPAAAQRALGMTQHRVGGGVVLAMARDPTGGYWSKALGFGVSEPLTADVVDEVVEVYRANGDGVGVLQVAPDALPEDWDDIVTRHRLVRGNTWVKLLRPAALEPAVAETDLVVRPATPADADAWARAFCTGFGMPENPHLIAFFAAATDGTRGFHPWGAWDGDRLVAAANLHVAGPAAAFCGAATHHESRGRGAQSAFMARRIEAARELGATWLSAETWKEPPGQHNPSLHNMRRAGFVDAYDRDNWLWRPDARPLRRARARRG
ncbi:MAG TPA: GNAT family N-acetyltransferase [Ornithinibacter sp.]|nr:GNAT family N-acetyltransferase [Ornithinibacter sp.]